MCASVPIVVLCYLARQSVWDDSYGIRLRDNFRLPSFNRLRRPSYGFVTHWLLLQVPQENWKKATAVYLLPQKKTLRWPVLGLALRASFNYANLRMCNTFGLEYSSVIRIFGNNSSLWAYCLSAEHGASAVGSDNRSVFTLGTAQDTQVITHPTCIGDLRGPQRNDVKWTTHQISNLSSSR